MREFTHNQCWMCLLTIGLFVLGAGTFVEAKVLYVANNGLDSASCGLLASPCRSLTQAIANASANDRIIVGPGRYGDLNEDRILGNSPGEENPPGGTASCFCIIHINK